MTADQFLDLWRRVFPRAYTRPIEEGGGYALVQSEAQMAQRVSDALNVTQQAYYLLPSSTQTAPCASGAAYATATVEITRQAPAGFDATLVAGTRVQSVIRLLDGTSIDGIDYELVADVTFVAGDLGPLPATIRAVRPGFYANGPQTRELVFPELGEFIVPGTSTAPDSFTDTPGVADRITIDMIGRFVRFDGTNTGSDPRRILPSSYSDDPTVANTVQVDAPPLLSGPDDMLVLELSDMGFEVVLTSALTGGLDGELDAIGDERRVFRQQDETDAAYRARIVTLPDVVSPAAMMRLASRVLDPIGIPWRYIDAGDPEVFTGFVWLPPLPGQIAYQAITIDWTVRRRAFAIAVGLGGADGGSFYDGTLLDDDNALDDGAFADGYPLFWTTAMFSLWAQLNEIRAGGVAAYILIDPLFFPP
jgi:hypothetical protein